MIRIDIGYRMKIIQARSSATCSIRWLFARRMTAIITGLLCVMITCISCEKATGRKKGSDFYVQLKNAQGLSAGAPVQWRGMEIGRVQSVGIVDGAVRVDVILHKNYREKLREGVRAAPGRGFLGRALATLDLYGGDDPGRSLLRQGALVAEAGLVDSFSGTYIKVCVWLLAPIALVLVVLVLLKKVITVTLVIILLTFAGWFCHKQWQKYGADIKAVRLQMQISDVARNMLTEEAAQDAWVEVQPDFAAAIGQFADVGAECMQDAMMHLCAALDRKVDDLTREGKERAAEEIQKLRENLTKGADSGLHSGVNEE